MAATNDKMTEVIKFGKFSHSMWNTIERKMSPAQLEVLDVMWNCLDPHPTRETDIKTCGEQLYLFVVRPMLSKLKLLPPIKPPAISTSGMKKKDVIIFQNTCRMLETAVSKTIATFSESKLNIGEGLRSKYAEVIIGTLIYAMKWHMINVASSLDNYELIVGVMKLFPRFTTFSNISQQAVIDLQETLEQYKQIAKFKIESMFTRFPRLCLSTKYDDVLPSTSTQLYPSQRELLDVIVQNQKFMLFYAAMIGSGKTTLSIALARHVVNRRQNEPGLQLLFICSVEPVRHQVCTMAFNKEIPFGVATIDQLNNLRVTDNFNCSKPERRIMIVSDLASAIRLLSLSNNYIVFLDEPTVGADQPDSPITQAVGQILQLTPARIILSSATLPSPNELPEIVAAYEAKHSGVVHQVCSREAMIGCEMRTFTGKLIAPHFGCQTVDELKHVISQIKTQLFIGRLYTAPLVYKINKKAGGVVDLDAYFSDISHMSQPYIQKIAVDILEYVASTANDNEIKTFCEDNDISTSIDLPNLLTTDAHKLANGCLCVVADPIGYAKIVYEQLFGKSNMTASAIITKYSDDMTKYKESIAKLDKIKNEEERTKQTQGKDLPVVEFPHKYRVNSYQHQTVYTSTPVHSNKQLTLEMLPMDLYIYDYIQLLLFAGVGIYSHELPTNYIDLILNLAAAGELAMIIADGQVCYGANYPLSNVLIPDEIVDSRSLGTIFQLCGRAGRVGTSWAAYIRVGDNTTQRIYDFIHGTSDVGVSAEAVNLTNAFLTTQQVIIEETDKPKSCGVTIVSLGKVREMAEEKARSPPKETPAVMSWRRS